jgi:hypothetical protein
LLQQNKKKKAMIATIVAFFIAIKEKKGDNNSYHHLLCCNRTKWKGRELTFKLLFWPINGGSHFKCSQALTMVVLASSIPKLWRWWLPLQVLLTFDDGGSYFKHSQALAMVALASSAPKLWWWNKCKMRWDR